LLFWSYVRVCDLFVFLHPPLHTACLHAASSQGINADCVDLDVHHWRVQICDITPLGLTRVFVCVTSFSSCTHLFTDGS